MFFKSLKNFTAFKVNGYFVIKNFLDKKQQIQLTDYYNELNLFADERISAYGVYTNIENGINTDKNKEIDKFIEKVCLPSLQKFFNGFQIGGGIFLLKGVGEKSVTVHQDWNMVDETTSFSFSVWCPLVDVDKNNGCLHVIPGSHNWFNNIRTSNIDSVYMPLDRIESRLVSLSIESGDAVVFAHNLFHGSKPNKSNSTRPAICLSVIPKNAKFVHFLRDGDHIKLIESKAHYDLDKLKKEEKNKELIVSTIPFKDEYLLTEEYFWKKYNQSSLKRILAKWANYISL
jgi:ectoine hydroxylase-related dioxygenase (phytanoyl-CoA dioxygenase family)